MSRTNTIGRVAYLVVLTTALLVPQGALAEDDLSAFLDCVEIENDIARLECFDAAVAALDLDAEPVADPVEVSTEEESAEPQKAQAKPTKRRPTRPDQIREADENMVESCEFLGSVFGKSGWGGLAAGSASKGTKRSAMKKAAKLGATHIVFGAFNNASGLQVSNREARAYYCEESDEQGS